MILFRGERKYTTMNSDRALEAAAAAYHCSEATTAWSLALPEATRTSVLRIVGDLIAGRRAPTCRRDRAALAVFAIVAAP